MTITITAAVAAYQSERWIGQTIESILAQTRPADEIIVVDDGSTDGTARELARFGDRIRVITRANGGCPAAFNTAFAAAGCDYVALCGADDIWEPRKLEWQTETLAAHPGVDIACGHARVFGVETGVQPRPPGTGPLDNRKLFKHLFAGNTICAPSAVIRRSLWRRLGPFVEEFRVSGEPQRFNADDYEFWMRALSAGARFFYDPRVLVAYRRHEDNITNDLLHMRRSTYAVHRRYARQVEDSALAERTMARDLFAIARDTVDAGRPHEARALFVASFRRRPSARALAWAVILGLPASTRDRVGRLAVAARRALAPAPTATTRWVE